MAEESGRVGDVGAFWSFKRWFAVGFRNPPTGVNEIIFNYPR